MCVYVSVCVLSLCQCVCSVWRVRVNVCVTESSARNVCVRASVCACAERQYRRACRRVVSAVSRVPVVSVCECVCTEPVSVVCGECVSMCVSLSRPLAMCACVRQCVHASVSTGVHAAAWSMPLAVSL